MLTLWGRSASINVRKVLWAAQEMGQPLHRIDVGGPAFGLRTPGHLAMNPNAMVPVLRDEPDRDRDHIGADANASPPAVTLWESNVIVRYLFVTYGEGAGFGSPAAGAARFIAEQWMDWQQTTLNPAGRHAFLQLVRTTEDRRDAAAVAASVAATEPLLDLLDAHLSRQPFIAGDRFGMADIPVGCEMHRWHGLPLVHARRPHLDAWYARLRERPTARGVLDLPLS